MLKTQLTIHFYYTFKLQNLKFSSKISREEDRKFTILLVDDEKEIADLVEVYLKNDGYSVYKFYNGKDALDCIDHIAFDMAILDSMLPESMAFRFVKRYGKIISSPPLC